MECTLDATLSNSDRWLSGDDRTKRARIYTFIIELHVDSSSLGICKRQAAGSPLAWIGFGPVEGHCLLGCISNQCELTRHVQADRQTLFMLRSGFPLNRVSRDMCQLFDILFTA